MASKPLQGEEDDRSPKARRVDFFQPTIPELPPPGLPSDAHVQRWGDRTAGNLAKALKRYPLVGLAYDFEQRRREFIKTHPDKFEVPDQGQEFWPIGPYGWPEQLENGWEIMAQVRFTNYETYSNQDEVTAPDSVFTVTGAISDDPVRTYYGQDVNGMDHESFTNGAASPPMIPFKPLGTYFSATTVGATVSQKHITYAQYGYAGDGVSPGYGYVHHVGYANPDSGQEVPAIPSRQRAYVPFELVPAPSRYSQPWGVPSPFQEPEWRTSPQPQPGPKPAPEGKPGTLPQEIPINTPRYEVPPPPFPYVGVPGWPTLPVVPAPQRQEVVVNEPSTDASQEPDRAPPGRGRPPSSGHNFRPGRNTKEPPKARATAKTAVAWGIANFVSEGFDILEVAHDALPEEFQHDKEDLHGKFMALVEHGEQMDTAAFVMGAINNQIEDYYFGLFGRTAKHVNQATGSATGGGAFQRDQTAEVPRPPQFDYDPETRTWTLETPWKTWSGQVAEEDSYWRRSTRRTAERAFHGR